MYNLKGNIILVTGANRGQGKAISKHLASIGGTVVVAARKYDAADEVAKEIGKENAYPVKLDVTKKTEWKIVIEDIIARFGKIDVLVNNAGILIRKPFIDISMEEYQELINVNQIGVLIGMQTVLPHMVKQQNGSIINNVSISAFAPIRHSSAYAASKAAVVAMSKAAAIEMGPYGIRINMVHPGGIETEMAMENESVPSYYNTVPLGRIGKPLEIAKAVAFLASDESSYCTGTELVVDGGMTL